VDGSLISAVSSKRAALTYVQEINTGNYSIRGHKGVYRYRSNFPQADFWTNNFWVAVIRLQKRKCQTWARRAAKQRARVLSDVNNVTSRTDNHQRSSR
jgi:hypothetical protein